MILIIGYGNALRTDDGIGGVLAPMLAQRLTSETVRLCLPHQLTPELVSDVAEAACVIFLDARMGDDPGHVRCEILHPQMDEGAFTHQTTPAGLLNAAYAWYGASPRGLLISVVGASFDYGERLSPEITSRLPLILDEIEHWVIGQGV